MMSDERYDFDSYLPTHLPINRLIDYTILALLKTNQLQYIEQYTTDTQVHQIAGTILSSKNW